MDTTAEQPRPDYFPTFIAANEPRSECHDTLHRFRCTIPLAPPKELEYFGLGPDLTGLQTTLEAWQKNALALDVTMEGEMEKGGPVAVFICTFHRSATSLVPPQERQEALLTLRTFAEYCRRASNLPTGHDTPSSVSWTISSQHGIHASYQVGG